MTSDLGRVTTLILCASHTLLNCGDVRSRTSYNKKRWPVLEYQPIAVTSDLGRVTTHEVVTGATRAQIAVTSDLGRVTTYI